MKMLHAWNAFGDDRTLCGLANEAYEDREATGVTEPVVYAKAGQMVDCKQCLEIIVHVYSCYTPGGKTR